MKCVRIIILLILASSLGITALSQEYLNPLEVNPALLNKEKQVQQKRSLLAVDTLSIPFIDDFSTSDTYPDPQLWADKSAYINSNLADNILTLGVATLDVIDSTGRIHDHATIFQFESEYLTSCPIDLENDPSDSIYLSFYYQAGGKVNEPEEKDSLVLEFLSVADTSWISVWSETGGARIDTFTQVMVPVIDTRFLQRGFRFRFKNYASINDVEGMPGVTGNQDFWHIDYIVLDANRTFDDTIPADVAFVAPIKSLLVNYESMPWKHFLDAKLVEMGSKLGIEYQNNGILLTNVTRNFEIRELPAGTVEHAYTGGAENIDSMERQFYNSNLIYTFDSAEPDSALFEVKSYLITDAADYKLNDTVTYQQRFFNYYSYDDGTVENQYGINGEGSESARLAYQFNGYLPDTLQAIDMYFNQTFNQTSQREFTLAIWDDNNGEPGNVIYQQEEQIPQYEEQLNQFHTYNIDTPFVIQDVFYIGWIQTSDTYLNLGFDIDRVSNDKIFYYLSQFGTWLNSGFEGSLMMRPVLGSSLPVFLEPSINAPGIKIGLYPNPASNYFSIEGPDGDESMIEQVEIYNYLGNLVGIQYQNWDRIPVSNLKNGIYFVRVMISGKRPLTRKLIITH